MALPAELAVSLRTVTLPSALQHRRIVAQVQLEAAGFERAPLLAALAAWLSFSPPPERPLAGGTGERLGKLRPAFEASAHLFASPCHSLNAFSQHLLEHNLRPEAFGAPSYPEMDARGIAAAAVGSQKGPAARFG